MATLEEIQQREIDMLKSFADIADAENIDYYLAFGTMLGAVRHKNIIPWDDDIDVYIKVKDYKHLRKALISKLPSNYFLQDPKSDRGITWIVPRIRDNKSDMSSSHPNYMSLKQKKKVNQGLYIDLFLLVESADTEKKRAKQIRYIYKYRETVANQRKLKTIKGSNFISTIYNCFREIFWYRPFASFCFYAIKFLGSPKSEFLICLEPLYKNGTSFSENYDYFCRTEILSKSLFNGKMKYKISNYEFNGIADYNAYLTKYYGANYMTPIVRDNGIDYNAVIIE